MQRVPNAPFVLWLNRWWGPKVLVWLALVVASFFIPSGFFVFYGNYVALIGAGIFILFGLILLVDFAHTWSETCMDKWAMVVFMTVTPR